MSHRILGLLFVCVLVLLLVGGAQAQIGDANFPDSRFDLPITSSPPDDDDEGDEGFGFGKKIAGTWLGMGSFDLDLDCDGIADIPLGIPAIDSHAIGVGATYHVTNAANPNTSHGTWKKTGHRQLTSRVAGYGSDPNCTDPEDDGICNGFGPMVSRFLVVTVLDFDENYQNATTGWRAIVYDPADDPLDPESVPTLCTVGAHTSFKKLNALDD